MHNVHNAEADEPVAWCIYAILSYHACCAVLKRPVFG